ncbi:MAG: cyanophycinase [Negativicutes bacterium]|nr:cyanophycinase [Negativicutes bacterium]
MVRRSAADRGAIVLIGGAEERSRRGEVLVETWRINRARRVAVVPSATAYPDECFADYQRCFRDIGAEKVVNIDVRSRNEANDSRWRRELAGCDLIFFSGGDQERLAECWYGSRGLAFIKRLHAAGATVAGTSAGAAAMATAMITPGRDDDLVKGAVYDDHGLGFITSAVVDTHFSQRGRIQRLAQFLARGAARVGIGVDEDTAAIIYADKMMRIVGYGSVTVLNGRRMRYTNYDRVGYGRQVGMDGLRLSFLVAGMEFDWRRMLVP